MKQIGEFFTYKPLPKTENHYLEDLRSPGGSLRFFMPDRCANYYALRDIYLIDTKKTTCVLVYTCETVLVPFLKAGYELLLYDVSKDLAPIFDERVLGYVSVVNLCGYYGFRSYDRGFMRKRFERGIIVAGDTTHSLFPSNGVDPYCDYVVGSMQKWIEVSAGGFAIKRKDSFSLPVLPPDETHLSVHNVSIRGEQQLLQSGTPGPQVIQKLGDTLWDVEMMLRRTLNSYGSGRDSEYIMRHYDSEQLEQRRRANYQYLLDHMPERPQLTVIFLVLKKGTVPDHLTIYVGDGDMIQSYLAGCGIKIITYWPQGPMTDAEDHDDAVYIYNHMLSFTCDQRYKTEDMEYICRQTEDMPEK